MKKEMICMVDKAVIVSCSDADYEQEKINYIDQLKQMKMHRVDPRFHDEGDTNIEDIFVPEQESMDMIVLSDADEPNSSDERVKKSIPNDKRGKRLEAHLSDPPSEDGGMSALDEPTDEENLPPPGKKRRSKCIRVRRVYFDEKNNMDQSQLCEGMCFSDATQFRRALQTWHIVQGRDYRYLKNNSDRIKVKCKQEVIPCSFHMLASQTGSEKTFQLRQMVEHTCPATNDTSRVNSTWLSKNYIEQFRSDPNWKIVPFMDQCMRDTGIAISKTMAYRAKRKAAENVLGNHKIQYKRIRDYMQTIIDKNPGSTAVVTTENRFDQGLPPLFNGLFICLNAQRQGFLDGCRPFISKYYNPLFCFVQVLLYFCNLVICVYVGIDGCFVKLTNGAQVLAASGRDGNNNMFPIAFAVVGAEDINSWTWFLQMLKVAIGEGEGHGGWTIMSDRQKVGLVLFP